MKIQWLEDKEKDGEIFSNSECLTYVIKHFIKEKRVELWGEGKGEIGVYETEEEANKAYKKIKEQHYETIWKVAKEVLKK